MSQKQGDVKRPPGALRPHKPLVGRDVHSNSSATLGGDFKRRRPNIPPSSYFSDTPVPTFPPPLPVIPLLYHLALSAHHASHRHLQQAFIPGSVIREEALDPPKFTAPPVVEYKRPETVTHDPQAADKALGLLLLALDLLKAGLASKDLSDKERVAFSLEFGVVGVKVLKGSESQGSTKTQDKRASIQVERGKLVGEVQDAVASGVCYLGEYKVQPVTNMIDSCPWQDIIHTSRQCASNSKYSMRDCSSCRFVLAAPTSSISLLTGDT